MVEDRRDFGGKDAYAVLGVPYDANDVEIVAAYRSLARIYHPDIFGDAGTARMSVINAAFDQLRDRRRRAAYDREIGNFAVHRPPPAAPVRAGPKGAGRSASATRPAEPKRRQYDWNRPRDGTGAAGPPPGRPSGSVLRFGRHLGWSIGEVARVDPGYLEWLEQRREGAPYLDEIDETLVRVGYRAVARRPRPAHRTAAKKRFRRS